MTLSRRRALAQLALFCGAAGLFIRDARGQTYEYDVLGRLRCVTYSDGSKTQYTYDGGGNRTQVVHAASGTFSATIAITGTSPVNLRTLADANGYDGARPASITFTLGSGVTITGPAGSSGSPNGGLAIDTGDWPTPGCGSGYSASLALQISGKVYGGGGKGANGASPGAAGSAGTGGDAIYCRAPITITVNSGGEVKSGGGGAGGGGGWFQAANEYILGGGGGGGGFPNGPGGTAGTSNNGAAPTNGGTATTSGGGAAGTGNGTFSSHSGGNGGAGGAAGAAGGSGSVAGGSTGGGWSIRAASSGSAAGYAIRKNGNTVPVTNNGTITGTQG